MQIKCEQTRKSPLAFLSAILYNISANTEGYSSGRRGVTRKRATILEASPENVLIFQGFRGIMQRKSSRFSLLLFSPFSLMFWEHKKHNLIRRCIEVVMTRNRVNRRKTGPWVRIPPPPPHQFPRGNPHGSWFFIGLHSRLPLIRLPLHPPRTVWSCSPDGHIHWL